MPKKSAKTHRIVWLRRLCQTAFLLAFLFLFLETTYHPINLVPAPVEVFFHLDPLVTLITWYFVYPALVLSSLVVLVTLLFGRWFCGWLCPFGVLHNAVTSLRKDKAKAKLGKGGFFSSQRYKYYILVFLLAGSLAGMNLAGWLDPFSFFYRALAVAVFPALNFATQAAFGWVYSQDPGIGPVKLTQVTEPVYEVLRENILAVEQPHYMWASLIGLLFVAVVVLNLYRPRFWCRVICPLGALLGLIGSNPTVTLRKDPARCNDCRLCVADCPGGADPNVTGGWKPSECFYCWNCESACPHQAISFGFRKKQEKQLVQVEYEETAR